MSTYPLVQVEGALAMPRMRPLNRVPPPFGREWALMPPHFSLRTELQALYAAFLRTMCLSAEAFRQVYRWDLHRRRVPEPPRPTAAPVGGTFNAAQAQRAAADTLQRPAAGAQPARTGARVERTPPPSHKLTASAVAIGGAVLLAWLVASHTQFGEGKDKTVLRAPASPASTGTSMSTRLSDERQQHDLALSGAVQGNQNTPATTAARAASASAAVTVTQRAAAETAAAPATPHQGPASASIIVTPAALPAPALASPSATAPGSKLATATRPDFAGRTRASTPQRATLTAKATKGRPVANADGRTSYKDAGRHPAHDFAPHRSAPLVTTQRTHGMYSEAGDYSPQKPSATSSDDYASLTTYAGTQTAPRPASRATVNVDNTEWVNHVSQRRVTEVPDSFAK
ncbi:hypothetical protein [Paraburkholderia sp. J63]|uniref:hypothetical protein n=1 Tax=Paraburkholderia sp. J63 TaxID=2805434 RepID=UPI002ABE32C6|nr:hypothetical protein [Paraburkholderia sp. J63]